MSPSRRRTRRRRDGQAAGEPPGRATPSVRPLPEWRWRTFPVYFALSLGLFIGVYLGAIGAFAADGGDGNNTFFLVVSVGAALFLGFGLSRLVVRFLLTRRFLQSRRRR